MTEILILALIVAVVAIALWYPGWRDRRITGRPFPGAWKSLLQKALPFLHRMRAEETKQLEENIQRFLAKKQFHGCGGLAITDEIRITIAAQACLLLLNRKTAVYPRLQHILVYPDAFVSNHADFNEDGTIDADRNGLLGESWHYGKVILSWDDVQRGIANIHDGHNVVLHEFSHQLDSESGSANGAPLLHSNSYTAWAQILSEEFEELNDDFEQQQESVMDYYGATNPAEFFAVATETFFEKPRQLRDKHPQLFGALKAYYAVDPTAWQ
jgi:hypothetical protein